MLRGDSARASGWVVGYDGYEPADETRREALCTLGNGYFATRGAAPESVADGTHYPGTYAAGVYNRLDDDIDGITVENESLVNLPNWLSLKLSIGGQWFDLDDADLLSYRQELDLHQGVLVRRLRFRDREGRRTTVSQRRLVHMSLPHVAAMLTTVTPENWSGELRVRSAVDARVTNSGVARYRHLSGQHLDEPQSSSRDGCDLVVVSTSQSRVRVAVAARTRALASAHTVLRPPDADPGVVGHDLMIPVSPEVPVDIEKVAVLYTSRDPAISEPAYEAVEELSRVAGWDDLLRRHVRAWDRLWRLFGLNVDEEPDLPEDFLASIRLGLFHLLQTVSPHTRDLDVGVPARGLHGEAYRGHVFWDELFVMPLLSMRYPGLSRALLMYRFRRLPAAIRAARDAGYRGAMFPWQSGSDGREESQQIHLNPASGHWLPDCTYLQRHSGLAVALSAWRFYETTRDIEFLSDYAAELVLQVALFVADLARYDRRLRRFVITGVVGPDEFHTAYPGQHRPGIDNNAYTNVMAAWVMRTALFVLDELPPARSTELMRSIPLANRDIDRWRRLAGQMYVPHHDDMIAQFDGYEDLAELDWGRYQARYGDIRRLDRILEAEGFSVNQFKASKQADVLMLFYLFSADELEDLLTGLGYGFDRAAIPATIDYYLARTCHGSTLSSLVHTWVLARANRHEALRFLVDVVYADSHDVQGGTTSEGIHLAAMVAGADLLERCFAGMEPRLDALEISPYWPATLGRMQFTVRYQGHELHITIGAHTIKVASAPTQASPVAIRCDDRSHILRPGQTVEIDMPSPGFPTMEGKEET